MVGQHHQLIGHEFEQIRGDSKSQGSLVCCSPLCCKELDMTEPQQTHAQLLVRVQLFAPCWTVACQAPLCVGFFRQE